MNIKLIAAIRVILIILAYYLIYRYGNAKLAFGVFILITINNMTHNNLINLYKNSVEDI